jgi:D-glycero-D-manno-heptose 1,7-bisphosphate phosphatase
MMTRFEEEVAHISAVYFRLIHPDYGFGLYRKGSYEWEPNPGMILRANDEFCIEVSWSTLLRDKELGIMAAKAAGVGLTMLLGKNIASAMPSATIHTLSDVINILSK